MSCGLLTRCPQTRRICSFARESSWRILTFSRRSTSFSINESSNMKAHLISVVTMAFGFLSIAHCAEDASRVHTIQVAGASKIMKATTDASGTIHLVFDAADGPRYIKSTDAGHTFSAPVSILDAAVQKPGLKFST